MVLLRIVFLGLILFIDSLLLGGFASAMLIVYFGLLFVYCVGCFPYWRRVWFGVCDLWCGWFMVGCLLAVVSV